MNRVLLKIIFLFTFLSFHSLQATVLSSQQLRSGLSKNDFITTLSYLSTHKSDEDQLWYWLDLARLQQANGEFRASILSFEKAYAILDDFENRATISIRNVGSFLGSSFLSKGSQTYYGKGYERTLMHTLNALNYAMLGDLEGSAVELRRMELRQEFWLQESEEKIKDASDEKIKAREQGSDISSIPSGYSMGVLLEDADVRAMANNYQDPFSYTLSSIIHDISGLSPLLGNSSEISLKRSIALNPESEKVFVKLPYSLPSKEKMKITVIVLSGLAPSLKVEKIRFPIFQGASYTSIDLPSYSIPINDIYPPSISTSQLSIQPPRLLKSDLMAYKTLKDELPAELAKSIVRATTKGVVAKQANDHFGDMGGLIASLLMDIGSSYSDSGFRNWEMLPNSGYLAQLEAKKGETVTITLNNHQESIMLPSNKKGVIILVSYLTQNNIRIDHVSY